jgi:hypothetical protein
MTTINRHAPQVACSAETRASTQIWAHQSSTYVDNSLGHIMFVQSVFVYLSPGRLSKRGCFFPMLSSCLYDHKGGKTCLLRALY